MRALCSLFIVVQFFGFFCFKISVINNFNDSYNSKLIISSFNIKLISNVDVRNYISILDWFKSYLSNTSDIIFYLANDPNLANVVSELSNSTVVALNPFIKANPIVDVNNWLSFEAYQSFVVQTLCSIASGIFSKTSIVIFCSQLYGQTQLSGSVGSCLTDAGRKYSVRHVVVNEKYCQTQFSKSQTIEQIVFLGEDSVIQTCLQHRDRRGKATWVIYGALQLQDVLKLEDGLEGLRRLFFVLSPVPLSLFRLVSTPTEQVTLPNLIQFLDLINSMEDFRNQLKTENRLSHDPKELIKRLRERQKEEMSVEIWTVIKNSSQTIGYSEQKIAIYKPTAIEFVSSEYRSLLVNSSSPRKYSFNNYTLRICAPEFPPFLGRNPSANLTYRIEHTSGFLGKILRYLMAEFQFQSDIYKPPDDQYGVRVPNQTLYSGCVGEIQSKNASFAVGIFTFNHDRNRVVDFSYPIMSDPLVILYQKPNIGQQWWNAFRPVSSTSWILSFAFLLLVAIVSTVLSRLSPFSAFNLQLPFSIRDEIHISENLWSAVGVFLLQGQDFYAYSLSARVISVTWWIFCAIFLAVYSADLTAYITTYSGPKTPNTLQEFANSDYLRLYLTTGYSSTASVQNSNDRIVAKLYSKSIIVSDCPSLIVDKKSSNVACISDYSWTLYLKYVNCTRYGIVSEILEAAFTGFMLPKYADFKNDFDHAIQTLSDKGVILKWFMEDVKTGGNDNCQKFSSEAPPIDFSKSAGIFILTYIFYIFGTILILFEYGLMKMMKFVSDSDSSS